MEDAGEHIISLMDMLTLQQDDGSSTNPVQNLGGNKTSKSRDNEVTAVAFGDSHGSGSPIRKTPSGRPLLGEWPELTTMSLAEGLRNFLARFSEVRLCFEL